MSSLLGQDLNLSLFVTPVGPQAILEERDNGFLKKKLILVICCFISVVLFIFIMLRVDNSSLHKLGNHQATSPTPYFKYLLLSGGQVATL